MYVSVTQLVRKFEYFKMSIELNSIEYFKNVKTTNLLLIYLHEIGKSGVFCLHDIVKNIEFYLDYNARSQKNLNVKRCTVLNFRD